MGYMIPNVYARPIRDIIVWSLEAYSLDGHTTIHTPDSLINDHHSTMDELNLSHLCPFDLASMVAMVAGRL
jgi:hypothetical protein